MTQFRYSLCLSRLVYICDSYFKYQLADGLAYIPLMESGNTSDGVVFIEAIWMHVESERKDFLLPNKYPGCGNTNWSPNLLLLIDAIT